MMPTTDEYISFGKRLLKGLGILLLGILLCVAVIGAVAGGFVLAEITNNYWWFLWYAPFVLLIIYYLGGEL